MRIGRMKRGRRSARGTNEIISDHVSDAVTSAAEQQVSRSLPGGRKKRTMITCAVLRSLFGPPDGNLAFPFGPDDLTADSGGALSRHRSPAVRRRRRKSRRHSISSRPMRLSKRPTSSRRVSPYPFREPWRRDPRVDARKAFTWNERGRLRRPGEKRSPVPDRRT